MSDEVLTITAVEQEAKTRRPRIWHRPRDDEQRERADEGLSWIAACGEQARPGWRSPRKGRTLAPIEKCILCADHPWWL